MSDLIPFEFDVVAVDAQGQERDRHHAQSMGRIESLSQEVSLQMIAIPGGTFLMGAAKTEEGWTPAQSPQHSATVMPFFISQYPIIQAQWEAVAALPKVDRPLHPDPANRKDAMRPVEQVTWYDAVEFCARLSQYTTRSYRLPSEAEWEYACRAGTITPFHFGDTITTQLANYSGIDWEYEGKVRSRGAYGAGPHGDDRRETLPVGSFQVANEFGLYDMHGNVREWCGDDWHDHYQNAPADGSVWTTDGETKKVLRGGSWNTSPRACRSAARSRLAPDASLYDIGFRVVYSE